LAPPATAPPETPVGAPAPAAGKPNIHFNQAQLDKSVGENVSMSIQVEDARDVSGAPFLLQFDPKILSLNEVAFGKFWTTDGQEPLIVINVQNDAGSANVRINRKPGTPAVSGTGDLLTLTFKAIGRGATTVSASSVTLNNAQNQSVGFGSPKVAINVK
jgi:general secretion pathway protein D